MVLARSSRAAIARKTFAQFGQERLAALLGAVDLGAGGQRLGEVLHQLIEPWGRERIGTRPRQPSHIADDGSPFEFSVAFSRSGAEVQVYVEPRGDDPGPRENQRHGVALLNAIAERHELSLARLQLVQDLFFPADPEGPFGIWIGASAAPDRAPAFKVYLNPLVRGRARAFDVIDEAAARLGFAKPWRLVSSSLARGTLRQDDIGILSLDLSSAPEARMKLYIRHHHAVLSDVKAIASLARDYRADDLARFYSTIAETEGPFLARPPQTELSFIDPSSDRPDSVTLEFPIESHVDDDEQARQRVSRCLSSFDIPSLPYERAVRAFATRPLELRKGIHAHVTLRRIHDEPRVGIYFASEAYVGRPALVSDVSELTPDSSERLRRKGMRA